MYYRKQEEYYNVLKNNPENIDNVDMSSMTFTIFWTWMYGIVYSNYYCFFIKSGIY